jgi:hypothetical protein
MEAVFQECIREAQAAGRTGLLSIHILPGRGACRPHLEHQEGNVESGS